MPLKMSSSEMCSDFLQAVFELFNKSYRVNHKDFERSANNLNKMIDKVNDIKTSGEAVELIGNVIDAVRSLKRKVILSNWVHVQADEIYSDEMELVSSCKRRIEHLAEIVETKENSSKPRSQTEKPKSCNAVESFITGDGSPQASGSRTTNVIPPPQYDKPIFSARFNRLFAEHLFAMGHYQSALALMNQIPDPDTIFVKIIEEALSIQEALLRGDTKPAHKWFTDSSFRLKHVETSFDFDLRIFEFYLLVREDKRIEAVNHARQYLNNFQETDHYRSRRLGQAMVLLIMRTVDEVKEKAKQNELNEEWIAKRFHLALMNFYSFTSLTPFLLTVRAGISAIKTPFCYHDRTRNPNCVTCHPLINRYAQSLVFGHHDQSILTCYQTGLVMNEDNPPMALPNGFVYSLRGIEQLTKDGYIRCPKTEEVFEAGQAKRVYVL
ncbi:hypothetical protein Aperf_G00000004780 [Anoplocephala perfoliata]